ncbi:hypothetical protein F4561_005200 [Lipingzhangella halophila]|uniref:Uncharacterized protein n=1 Tax=Lipingzhangella halophila TaxID=1783352 RepID=A0A7W7W605_9ACTN|nr:hypothetical protein [Lipingzhangella halophila]MBB4934380.1 hypothetical protein [Lipingzhangella halophila]
MRIAQAHTRARVISSIRDLADVLDRTQDIPIPEVVSLDLTYFPHGDDEERAAEVDRVADLIGTIPRFEGEHYVAEHRTGHAAYRVVAIFDDTLRHYQALMSYRDNVHP